MSPTRPHRTGTTAALLLLLAACVGCDGHERPSEPTTRTTGTALPRVDGPLLYVLGTVQDGGLPHAACSCVRCTAARDDPHRARRVASLAIVLPEPRKLFLIDATPDIRDQLHELRGFRPGLAAGFDRAPVDGVLLTHAHMGHYTGLAFFGFEAVHTRQLPVYCTTPLAAYLRDNGPWSQLVGIGNVELREITDGEDVDLGQGLRVTPVAVPHRDEYADTVGFVVRGSRSTVFYVPDTDNWFSWDPAIEASLDGIDVAILDGTFYSTDELPGRDVASIGHPLITDSMDRLEPLVKSGRLRVFFTHLNHSNPALDPAGAELREIRRRGFDVLAEGQSLPL